MYYKHNGTCTNRIRQQTLDISYYHANGDSYLGMVTLLILRKQFNEHTRK